MNKFWNGESKLVGIVDGIVKYFHSILQIRILLLLTKFFLVSDCLTYKDLNIIDKLIFLIMNCSVINDGKYINNEYNDVYLVTTLDPIPLEAFTLQVSIVYMLTKWTFIHNVFSIISLTGKCKMVFILILLWSFRWAPLLYYFSG